MRCGLAALLLGLAMPAWALPPGIMRCERPDGSVYYTDAGCPQVQRPRPAPTPRSRPEPAPRPRMQARPVPPPSPAHSSTAAPAPAAPARRTDPWQRLDFPVPPPGARF